MDVPGGAVAVVSVVAVVTVTGVVVTVAAVVVAVAGVLPTPVCWVMNAARATASAAVERTNVLPVRVSTTDARDVAAIFPDPWGIVSLEPQ